MLLTLSSAVEQPTATTTKEFQLETNQMSMHHLKQYLYKNKKNECLDCLSYARLCLSTPNLVNIHQLEMHDLQHARPTKTLEPKTLMPLLIRAKATTLCMPLHP